MAPRRIAGDLKNRTGYNLKQTKSKIEKKGKEVKLREVIT
jgi:hypothetical protein